jgi:hypothetical protein
MPYPITVSLCLVNGKPGYDLTIHDELAMVLCLGKVISPFLRV